jgi:hypothetical protein
MQNWRRWVLRPGGGADYRLNLSQSGLAEVVPGMIDPDPIFSETGQQPRYQPYHHAGMGVLRRAFRLTSPSTVPACRASRSGSCSNSAKVVRLLCVNDLPTDAWPKSSIQLPVRYRTRLETSIGPSLTQPCLEALGTDAFSVAAIAGPDRNIEPSRKLRRRHRTSHPVGKRFARKTAPALPPSLSSRIGGPGRPQPSIFTIEPGWKRHRTRTARRSNRVGKDIAPGWKHNRTWLEQHYRRRLEASSHPAGRNIASGWKEFTPKHLYNRMFHGAKGS